MTYCESVLADLAFNCKSIGNDVVYVQSPFGFGFDGQLIGSYLIGSGSEQVKITDNADLMFQAMVNGVNPQQALSNKVRKIVESAGLEFSDEGEIFAYAKQSEVPSLLAKLVEASIKSADILSGAISRDVSKFEKVVGNSLKAKYGKAVRVGYQATGASGHKLRFPFAVTLDSRISLIQPISSFDEKLHWSSVYSAVGKMLDVKNSDEEIGRFAVLEQAQSEQISQAKKVLNQAATVLVFSDNFALPMAA